MKNYLLLIFCFTLLNCSQETELDWKQQIDKQIKEYNKNLIVEESKDFVKGEEDFKVKVYKKKNDFQRISSVVTVGDFEMKSSYYFLKDKIVKVEESGILPLIYKRKRKENEPCCSVSESEIYFKSEDFGMKKHRAIQINSTEEAEGVQGVLQTLPFKGENIETSEYKRLKTYLERLLN